ncbi:TBC1 domain family member 5 [Geodia barretti]|uniref:TBC1 domain family member 5 n=1 Tax=Geodia barretti TaxID=519541 RepID=A0AA35WM09_GEOBA|nr:TBC1 domain family member 5 [Geodia barretti]
MDPHQVTASLDVALNNPLSQSEESPWNRFFQDNDLRQLVSQDVVRTFPDNQFFRQDDVQQMMEDILFCYVKENPDLGYRQGMHELLAPILFVMNAEMRDVERDESLTPVLKVVMDPSFIEHDTYAIFTELMEMVEPWYSCTGLEADQVKARQQASLAQRKNMSRDPRTSRPFEDNSEFYGPSSAISRKLDVVHNILLKKADEVLYHHLKQLSIPAQTYGMCVPLLHTFPFPLMLVSTPHTHSRWIRLLFGREFPLPNVLEVWDALFADGPSLVDYMCVSMLMHIREVLIEGDYATSMHHLMHFPTVYEVNYLIQRSLHLRNPSQHPSPRVWAHRHHHQQHNPPSLPTHPSPLSTPTTQLQKPSRPKQAGAMAKQALTSAGKQLIWRREEEEEREKEVRRQPTPRPPLALQDPSPL